MESGTYPIQITLEQEGEIVAQAETEVTIYDAVLPKQEIIHTEWFYPDCLADYYGVPVFSEEHWEIIENFLKEYVKRGCNMILTAETMG